MPLFRVATVAKITVDIPAKVFSLDKLICETSFHEKKVSVLRFHFHGIMIIMGHLLPSDPAALKNINFILTQKCGEICLEGTISNHDF